MIYGENYISIKSIRKISRKEDTNISEIKHIA